jgi:Protein of unknown function (DUF3153)
MSYRFTSLERSLTQFIIPIKVVWVIILALCLSGCVQYEIGVNYANQHRGEIVQHIRLGKQLTSFSGSAAQDWLKRVERRTKQVGGRVRQRSNEELIVTIPFYNGVDLESKFNQFFQAQTQMDSDAQTATQLNFPSIESHLKLKESNFLLLLRNHLIYDVDLRSLGIVSSEGNLLISPGTALNLEFSLTTPWGAHRVTSNSFTPQFEERGKQLVWTLNAGEVNHLEAIFWVPSPLGIGTVAIILFVGVGAYLKSFLG